VLLRMSTLFLRTLREDPAEAEVPSHKLLVRAGFIRRAAPGGYTWLPLGKRVLDKITRVVHEEMAAIGAQEVHFPALLPREAYEQSGRWLAYGNDIFRLKDRRGADYLLAPTHEEMFTLLVKDLYASYKDYPVILYQVQTKFRDEARPRAGLLRGREFLMKDSYSFDLTDDGLAESYARHRAAYIKIFDRLGLTYTIVSAASGAMGGSGSEEFLADAPVGEDTFVGCTGCDYAANTEAVVTPAPEPGDPTAWPPMTVHDTPDTPTIESLVDLANERKLGGRADWTAADTLKNVVLKVTPPGGEPEILVVGLPGDREVDLRRIEASLYPATVALFEAADFAQLAERSGEPGAAPTLVRGYIGPQLPELAGPADQGGRKKNKIRYLVDPRVVTGTSWLTGANEEGRHAINVVAGRDFVPDGTIEAAEVRPGDPCPRCSVGGSAARRSSLAAAQLGPQGGGELTLRRGIEIGHIFMLGRRFSDAFELDALGPDGKPIRITMGSYGIGISRLVAMIAEQHHDEKGLVWPAVVAPAHVHIVPATSRAGKGAGADAGGGAATDHLAAALKLGEDLSAAGVDVIVDDRPGVSVGVRLTDAELIGAPWIVVVGRRLGEGLVEVRQRATGQVQDMALADVVARAERWVGRAE
jgi:prolyl-tRNA synthetase, family II